MDRRRMCPNCRAFISSDDRVCQYCGFALSPPVTAPSLEAASGLIPEHAFTTFMLLVINGAMWAISVMISRQSGNPSAISNIDGQTLVALGAKFTPYIRDDGQWWRLITAGFLHGGAMHILMNGWAMLVLGRQVDIIYGSARYLVIFFAGTVGGFWLSMVMSPQSLSVGASAGLCGLVGAMIALGFLSRSSVALELRKGYLRYAGFLLAFGALSFLFGLRIDNYAHFGGMCAGFAVAMVLGLPRPTVPIRERLCRLAAWMCVLLTLVSFYHMVGFYSRIQQAPEIPSAPVIRRIPSQRL